MLQTSLDDFYVSYEINAYTKQPQKMAASIRTYTRTSRINATKPGSKSCLLTMELCAMEILPPYRRIIYPRIIRRPHFQMDLRKDE